MAGGSCNDGGCWGGCKCNCYGGCSGSCFGTASCSCGGSSCSSSCSGGCSGCGSGCAGTCSGSCEGGCSGDCEGGCRGDCGSGCSGGCSGSCKGYCRNTCSTLCNTACTATNQAQNIANLGARIIKGETMYASDINAVKNAIVGEFTRRSRSGYTSYTVPPASNVPIQLEHGKKILEDCYIFDSTKDWRSNITDKGTLVKAESLRPAIEYIKTLMNTVVPVR